MTCTKCGEKPEKSCGAFPKAVIEIDNPEKIVLLRKVMVPASMGDESAFPPAIGKYHNVLLEYEASGGIYLYSSDGIPTKLSSDTTELQAQLNALRVRVGEEEVARAGADTTLSNRITSLDNSLATVAKTGSYNDLSNKPTIGNGTLTIKKNGSNVGTFTANATANKNIDISVPTKTSDLVNDGSDGASQYVENDDLATVATSGSYNDLTNKPTIGNATLTIKRNNTNAGTFTANATTNKSINIAVPTKTSDLTNDGSDGTSTYVESDDLPTVDTTYSSSSNNAIANSTVTNSLDRNVMTNLALDSTPSTTTVNLNNTKTNLAYPSSSTTSSISLPVASSTQAGVMNSATFDAVANNTNNINAIMNGAVAISNLPASPTQAELTTAWENETGLPSLINRASVYDVTNNKVWTYYTNDQTWHAASNTSQVTVNTFTNSSEGTIKGSTNNGQVFAESDGTGSVNGWDALNSAVSSNTSKLATIAQGAEVNVQSDWTQTNTSADDYIKNKPANLVQDANYVHTDNNFTTTLKNKLDGIESGAEVNVQSNWSQTDTTADDYIKNKPTIPTVNNATLTIQKNGTNVQTFTANSSTNKTANITVPTAVSELTNDSGYATTTQLNNGLATKQDTLTAGDNIQINGNTISATDTTYTAGNAIDITNGEISADIHPADFFTAEDTISDCGSDLSLDDTMASTLRSVELKGDTYQQTYSGKNFCSGVRVYSDNALRLYLGNQSQIPQTFTLSFICPTLATSPATAAILVYYEAGTNSGTVANINAVSGQRVSVTVSLSSAQWASLRGGSEGFIQLYSTGAWTGTTDDDYGEPQIEAGSTATSYEPYVGGISAPNPDYPQDIKVVTGEQTVTVTGKNLFNKSTVALGENWNGTIGTVCYPFQTQATRAVVLIPVKPNTTYTLKLYSSGWYMMERNEVDSSYVVVDRTQGINQNEVTAVITTTAQTNYIGVKFKYGSGGTTAFTPDSLNELKMQLEIGSTATDYEPYQSQSYTINLGSIELYKIGDYQDYIYKSGDDWYLHAAMGKITLDGSETWSAAQMTNNWMYYTINAGMATVTSSQMPGIISNYFGVATTDGQWTSAAGSKSVTLSNTASPNTQIRFTVGDNTNKLADFKTWLSTHNTTVYYALATPTNILIENPTLIAQLDALAGAKSYNDQTNIIVAAAGDNLPATLCVETYRKSLDGVIEAIDSACTCRKNLVVYLPNGMTTYTNDDAPIPIPEVVEAFKRGQSVFLVDDALPERIYTVTAADADDGIYSMRADQTGINSRIHDGYWHISGGGDVWDQVEFIQDDTPYPYRMLDYDASIATWQAFGSRAGDVYFPASEDVTFMPPSGGGSASVASLWEKMNSGEEIRLRIPLQAISNASVSLVEEGYFNVNPMREIIVELGPQHYYDYDNGVSGENNYKVQGYMIESTSYVPFGGMVGPEDFLVGIVKVTQGGASHYIFVTSLRQDRLV